MSVGTYIRRRREAAGLSIEDIVLALGNTPAHRRNLRAQLEFLERDRLGFGMVEASIAVLAGSRLFAFDPHIARQLLGIQMRGPGAGDEPHICRACGCSYFDACEDPDFGPCAWSDRDPGLCTACEPQETAHG